MHNKKWSYYRFLFFFLLVGLSACTFQMEVLTPEPLATAVPVSLNMDSTSEQIQRAMQESAATWTTLQMEGNITWYLPDGTTQEFQEKVWLDPLRDRYKVELNGVANSTERSLKISDGVTIFNINMNTGQVESYAFPDSARVGQYIPPIIGGDAYPNPIWGQIGSPLSELAFSSDYAQNAGLFKPVGMETIAGRTTLIVEWQSGEGHLPSGKMWLDSETAVLLKLQQFGKDGSRNLEGELVVNNISFDQSFDPGIFSLPTDLPQAVNPTPIGSMRIVIESNEMSEVEAGELYFFTRPRLASQSLQLVKVSALCIVDGAECSAVEKIEVPFALNFNVEALSWSPDGKYAAFAYSDNPNTTPTKLWLFDADAKTWTSLIEFPYIDPPIWSRDGSWIAFRTQDGVGGEDVHVIRPDGSELMNISANLPLEEKPYVMDGWYTENIIMRSGSLGKIGSIYLVRAADGKARPMFETLLTKAQFVASPDAGFLVYDEYDYEAQKHILKVIEPDGANAETIASFLGGSIYPLIWSPDSHWIAFTHSSDLEGGESAAEVYVVSRTGKKLSLVYKGATVGRLIFSPSGKYLLIEEDGPTSTSGGHALFWVDLSTLKQEILRVPALSTDYDWYAPSWRP